MNNKIISIIVPIYLAEQYLEKCIQSFLQQTYADFELLLIDDGSPDASGAIADRYAQNDARIKVFHTPNQGQTKARALAFEKSCGDYIICADPDDWVEPTMLQDLLNAAESAHADVVICDLWIEHKKNTLEYVAQSIQSCEPKLLLKQTIAGEIQGSLCNKLIKRDVFITHQLSLDNDLNYWEDAFFCCQLFQQPIVCTYVNKAYYHYVRYNNSNSLVSSLSIDKALDWKKGLEIIEADLQTDRDYFKSAFNRAKKACKLRAWRSQTLSKLEFLDFFAEINTDFITENSGSFIPDTFTMVLALKGHFTLASILLNVYEKLLHPIIRSIRR